MLPLVSLTLFLPLVGAVLILCLPKPATRTVHVIAIITAALTLIGALSMWFQGASGAGFSQVEELQWIPAIGAAYRVGVDGISLPLVLLSAVLFLVAVIYTSSLRERPRAYIALVLLLETASIGTFTALDGILFYVFFEVSLVSMYFMIAGWGHEDRQRAALMFLYTPCWEVCRFCLLSSGFIWAAPNLPSTCEPGLRIPPGGRGGHVGIDRYADHLCGKDPAVPLHTWLPAAHVQAPTVGSVILAGVMLKFGTYGLVRFALQMTPMRSVKRALLF